jgi:hypothetical protein
MDSQAHTGDTVLVYSRKMTGGTKIRAWWLWGERGKTTENKLHFPIVMDMTIKK